ncbi:hypothetical protein [Sulfurimonas sp.]|uniref:hypothetical protein n=1 Tax=Sulfurimonas sp. TaxID=2022749 RepID=UPI002AB1D1C8|nr:hypothetical protein [Sulfurimonas sp.]
MNIEKLFRKAEKFFVLDSEIQEGKENKREKLERSFSKKIANIKKKIKKTEDSTEKKKLKKTIKCFQ